VDDKHLFRGAAQLLQSQPDLFNTVHLPKVHIDHQDAVQVGRGVAGSQYPGDHVVPRFEHCANGRQFRRFVSNEMDEHLKMPNVELR